MKKKKCHREAFFIPLKKLDQDLWIPGVSLAGPVGNYPVVPRLFPAGKVVAALPGKFPIRLDRPRLGVWSLSFLHPKLLTQSQKQKQNSANPLIHPTASSEYGCRTGACSSNLCIQLFTKLNLCSQKDVHVSWAHPYLSNTEVSHKCSYTKIINKGRKEGKKEARKSQH